MASVLLMIVAIVACSAKTEATGGLQLIVATNLLAPTDFDTVRLEVRQEVSQGQWGSPLIANDFRVPGETTLPTTFAIVAGKSANQNALIRLVALEGQRPLVLREVQIQVPTTRVAALKFVLASSCAGKLKVDATGSAQSACADPMQSCQPDTGECGSTVVDPASLPNYNPGDENSVTVPPPGDAGVTADASADAALPRPPDSGIQGTIFTQTGRALHVYDPYSKVLRAVGPFSCLPQNDLMLDIAVDRDSNIFGTTTLDRFVKIDPLSGACTVVRQGTGVEYPQLLAFVPRGTLDPASDTLVGYDDETYLRIDVRTGAVTKIGTLNAPDAGARYSASGDLIFAGANGMFITATVPGTPADAGDAFVRFDPNTGRRVGIVGSTGYRNLFGLGYWGGRIFAFTTPGEILQIDPRTAKVTLVKHIDGGTVRDGAPSDPVFYGAGSTTVAPETPTP